MSPAVDTATAVTLAPAKPTLKLTTQHIQSRYYSHLLYVDDATRASIMSRSSSSRASSVRSSSQVSARSRASSSTSTDISLPTSVADKLNQTPQPQGQCPKTVKYVDDHYPLITSIGPANVPATVDSNHTAFFCAHQMAQIHNCAIRALNAAYNQCLLVQPGTKDAEEFLGYNQLLAKFLDHHHSVEDDYMFPAIEKLLGRPDAMEENTQGHERFMDSLKVFESYVFKTGKDEYNGLTLRHIIEAFGDDLVRHLHDEIPTLRDLYVVDSDELMKIWRKAEEIATKENDLWLAAPWVLSVTVTGFEIDGEAGLFPEVPRPVEWAVRKLFSIRYRGLWRWAPVDMDGQRRVIEI